MHGQPLASHRLLSETSARSNQIGNVYRTVPRTRLLNTSYIL